MHVYVGQPKPLAPSYTEMWPQTKMLPTPQPSRSWDIINTSILATVFQTVFQIQSFLGHHNGIFKLDIFHNNNRCEVTWTSPRRESWEDETVPRDCSAAEFQSAAACSSACTDSAHGKTAPRNNITSKLKITSGEYQQQINLSWTKYNVNANSKAKSNFRIFSPQYFRGMATIHVNMS